MKRIVSYVVYRNTDVLPLMALLSCRPIVRVEPAILPQQGISLHPRVCPPRLPLSPPPASASSTVHTARTHTHTHTHTHVLRRVVGRASVFFLTHTYTRTSLQLWSSQVAAFIREVVSPAAGGAPVVLAGNSLGGYVSARLSASVCQRMCQRPCQRACQRVCQGCVRRVSVYAIPDADGPLFQRHAELSIATLFHTYNISSQCSYVSLATAATEGPELVRAVALLNGAGPFKESEEKAAAEAAEWEDGNWFAAAKRSVAK